MKWHAVFDSGSRFIVTVFLTASLPMRAGDSIARQPKTAQPAATTLTLMKVPLVFERGLNETASEDQFISRGPGYSLFLTPSDPAASRVGTETPGHRLAPA